MNAKAGFISLLITSVSLSVPMLWGSFAEAKTFRNAYVSFELADRWNCVLEQTEWVCRTTQPGLAEAIIILTAKEVGPQDGLPSYETHLKSARTIMSRSGSPLQSTVYKVGPTTLNNQPWIDGMHLSSEVPNYYTRYLATTKEKIAVLVTFSAHKTHYSKYSSDFLRAVQSLRVIATRALMNNGGANGSGGMGSGEVLGSQSGDQGFAPDGGVPDEGSGGGADGAKPIIAIAILIGAVGVYLMLKRGKGGGGSKSSKSSKSSKPRKR